MILSTLKPLLSSCFFITALFAKNPCDWVDPFIGTGGHGHTFPGAALPSGMVQLSPDTRVSGWDACAGYHYSDNVILGFSHTHLSGTGVADYGDVLIMPFSGKLDLLQKEGIERYQTYSSPFDHSDETAEPGYYRVKLARHDIDVELTVTERTGFHKYEFSSDQNAGIVIDLSHLIPATNWGTTFVELRVVNDREIEGYQRTQGWATNHHVYFNIRFDHPFEIDFVQDGMIRKGSFASSTSSLLGVLNFGQLGQRKLMSKIGLSNVSYEGAKRNLEAENSGWDFDAIRRRARGQWQQALSKIELEGGSDQQKVIFYTALYHSLLAPYIFSDTDGRYRGMDQRIHRSQRDPAYTVFSLWDTFRALHPLLTIIDPPKNELYIRTLLEKYKEGGRLPKWELNGNYTGTMIGSHALSVICDAYIKGDRDFDLDLAIEAMKKSLHYSEQDDFLFPNERVRKKLNPKAKKYNDEIGYIPCDLENESVSKALEYAYNDWCLYRVLEKCGRSAEAKIYKERSSRYRQYFDRNTGFMRGLDKNKKWKTPFDPTFSRHRKDEYCEGNAWQWTFFVPHDIQGLSELMGGVVNMTHKMDQLFTISSAMAGDHVSNDISGLIGQYAHGNEPSHHIAHMYSLLGQPYRTQEIVDKILSVMYNDSPDGLSGNEDCGQMSAWYILNAMGIYPYCPGNPSYVISRPLFDRITIHLETDKKLEIVVHGNSTDNKYVKRVTWNGDTLAGPLIDHATLMEGGLLEYYMMAKPKEYDSLFESTKTIHNSKR